MLTARLSEAEHGEFDDLAKPFRAARAIISKLAREMRHGTEGKAAEDLANHLEAVLSDADAFCALSLYDRFTADDEDERKALTILQNGVPGCPQKIGRAA